jgi:hypothetical protein
MNTPLVLTDNDTETNAEGVSFTIAEDRSRA